MLKKVPLLCCDEITNGLDANSALSVTDALKQTCKRMGSTVFCSLLQPSPAVYSLFDRVIMLYQGRVLYSGSRISVDANGGVLDRVLEYFDSIGLHKPSYMPTPDFLDQVGYLLCSAFT